MSEPSKPTNGPKPNGASAILSTLAHSSDRIVQIGTLALIGLSGIGNWFATNNSGDRNREQIEINREVNERDVARLREDVRRQVGEIHGWLQESKAEFHQGNEDSAEAKKLLATLLDKLKVDLNDFERSQTEQTNNQTIMIKNQNTILSEIHQMVTNYESYKRNEQMRGAP